MIKSNFVNFELYDKDDFIFRANNFPQSYHRVMNNIIECNHPKMSYFVFCIGKYIQQKYEDYCLIMTQKKTILYNKWNLCSDIETFVKKYISKFDTKLEPSLIIQSEIDTIKNIKAIA